MIDKPGRDESLPYGVRRLESVSLIPFGAKVIMAITLGEPMCKKTTKINLFLRKTLIRHIFVYN